MKITPINVDNLIRDGETGIYYARIKIRQKVYVRSLGQKSDLEMRMHRRSCLRCQQRPRIGV